MGLATMGRISQALLYLLLLSVHIILISADDASAMAKLESALKPSGSKALDFCSWDGVRCNNARQVTSLKLNSMALTGTLPSALRDLTRLQVLSLQDNSFTGSIPSLANLTFLEEIYLDSNNFTSFPDGFFQGLTSLQIFSVSENLNLAPWTIPSDLTELTSLVTFSASSANIIGQIPDIFETLALQNLRISYNNLTGPLPKSLSGSGIRNLWLNNQAVGLSGSIDVISNMTQISQVWLQNNLFTGPIPDLSNCASLFDLQLRDNQFTGVIPLSLTTLTSLANISLDNNKLQGPMPVFGKSVLTNIGIKTNSFCTTNGSACDPRVTTLLEVAGSLDYPMALAESWEGNNPCQDWQFITCEARSKNITTVNFGKQGFSGIISPSFANLTSLKVLYLNDNNLTGTIPASLTTLPQLQLLDVSNNNLSGKIPTFLSSVKVTTTGNALIGKDTGSGGTSGKTPGSGSKPGTKSVTPSSSISPGVIVGVVLGILVFAGIILFFCYICWSKRWRQKLRKVENHQHIVKKVSNGNAGATRSEILSQSSGDYSEIPNFENGNNVAISIQVLRQVTNNFSEDNILGKGGFGTVYKGELHDGTKIAVKRMESVAMGSKGMKEFEAEIAFLTKVRHRHLVALLGFCTNGGEKLLVFEYMPNGTLGQHLFEWRENGLRSLKWLQRVTIALDVARGVEYLHSLAQQSFIHRDLKPNNILLGDDMRAKVADFGLVKNAPDGKYSVETRLAGTFGYLAPEYAATGRVTTKVDVYAFGVVLMELITGRKALDETMSDERCHLVTYFRRLLINPDANLLKAVDQALEPDDETLDSIRKVAELAGHCTGREPHQRPDMSHAVNVLGPLVQLWRPTNREEEEVNNGIDLDLSLPQALQKWRADEGNSGMFNDGSCIRDGFADTFDSMDAR